MSDIVKKEDYDFDAYEIPLFNAWNENGFFKRSKKRYDKNTSSYTVVIPPPNITGVLHMGHALNDTIQDACIRRSRMQGHPTRWILGTDHAGIATQTKVDKKLNNEGISRYDIGREKFIEECWKWRKEYGSTIIEQIKGMGCSCDYSDEHFTLDDDYAQAVKQVFCDWYHDGLIYRGKRIVNWCLHCTTAIADDEAEYVPESGHLWHLRYPLSNPIDGQEYIVVATTRPETMLGDTGVAVSPSDPSKEKFIGQTVKLPLVDREIPIFSDYVVDPEFGSGFVKVTPSHDPNDWAMGQRHDLPRINIFDEKGVVVDGYGKFSGMNRDEARIAIVEEFEKLGLLDHVEYHDHSVMTCYRCHTKLEPWESEQWFVAVDSLKEPARQAVESGDIRFYPDRWKNVYLDWLENLKDWCISRQLWWGHRIPMYYCTKCGWQDARVDAIFVCPDCGCEVIQDENVLDTWFSSQLWPFATQGWTSRDSQLNELDCYYPTQVLSTARDIMGLWVARMVMASLYCTGKIPFENVIIHPTVMGSDGKPMSKSRGNGVDPLRLMQDYGADGMRFGLLMQVTGAQELKFNESKLVSSRNFSNKIKNAARFVSMNLDGFTPGDPAVVSLADVWIFSRLAKLVKSVDEAFEQFEFGEATRALYHFFWNEFCDWYIEFSKPRLMGDNQEDRLICQRNLIFVLENAIKLLHPVMPFITEKIYQDLPFDKNATPYLIIGEWPRADHLQDYIDNEGEESFQLLCQAVSSIRSIRARYGISPRAELNISIKADEAQAKALLSQQSLLASIVHVEINAIGTDVEKSSSSVVVLCDSFESYIDLEGYVDFELERNRLGKQLVKLQGDLEKLEKKLSNKMFLERASADVIATSKNRKADILEKIAKLNEQIEQLM